MRADVYTKHVVGWLLYYHKQDCLKISSLVQSKYF